MTEARVRVRTRLRPFVAEFLSDIQLSLRFNSLSNTEANASVSELLFVLLPLKSTDSWGNVAELLCTVKKVGRIAIPRFFSHGNDYSHPRVSLRFFQKVSSDSRLNTQKYWNPKNQNFLCSIYVYNSMKFARKMIKLYFKVNFKLIYIFM